MIPSVFIALISFLFTRLKLFRQKEITVYIMVSGIIWGGVGISLFSNLVDSFGGTDWIRIIVIVLAGVCGGWVMAQLEHGNSGSITVYEPNEII